MECKCVCHSRTTESLLTTCVGTVMSAISAISIGNKQKLNPTIALGNVLVLECVSTFVLSLTINYHDMLRAGDIDYS